MSAEPDGEQLAAISNAIVKIYSDSYGRGPTKAKTYAFDDYVLCVLEDILTTVERDARGQGRGGSRARACGCASRRRRRSSSRTPSRRVIGRPVVAYNSQVTFHPAVGFEMFVLGD